MDAKKLFLYDCKVSLLEALLFLWTGVILSQLGSGDGNILLIELCLFHVFFVVVVWCVCRDICDKYSDIYRWQKISREELVGNEAFQQIQKILESKGMKIAEVEKMSWEQCQKAEQEKFRQALLTKSIVILAEFLIIVVLGLLIFYGKTIGLAGIGASAIYFLVFVCLISPIVRLAEIFYWLNKCRQHGVKRSFLGFYFSEDGKCAYGNLREE